MRKQLLAIAVFSLLACGISSAQKDTSPNGPSGPTVIRTSEAHRAVHFSVSPELRELIRNQPSSFGPIGGLHEAPSYRHPKLERHRGFARQAASGAGTTSPTGAFDTVQSYVTSSLSAPTVGVNALGVGVGFFGYTVPDAPTDVNLAVGDTQVVQWVNVQFAVFDKTNGNNILYNGTQHYVNGNVLWSSLTGSQCATHNSGDIIVLFDKMAHRWVMMQPVFSSPFATCFAISTTPDFMGSWYLYQFPQTAGFPDYPKVGVWIDGYYQSNNVFNAAGTVYLGAQPCAYNRAKMLVGDPTAEQVCVLDNSNGTLFDDSMLPADIDSQYSLPPVGTPEIFLGSIDNFVSDTHLYEYTMAVNWSALTATLTGINGATPITVNSFVGSCTFGSTACVPQAGTTAKLQTLGDRLMYRLAYRNSGNARNRYNSFLVSHSIAATALSTGPTAERWYELRSTMANPTTLSVYQQGTYAPSLGDGTLPYRWMGSLAMDKMGNIALGYSRSSGLSTDVTKLNPDIYYTSRAAVDPLGTMGPENAIVDQTVATGSQPDTSSRWGDYTSMAIDNDGCTMWYSNQYYTSTVRFNWSTRIASIKFAGCQ